MLCKRIGPVALMDVCSSARPLLDMPMEMCTGFRDQLLCFPCHTHIVLDLAYKRPVRDSCSVRVAQLLLGFTCRGASRSLMFLCGTPVPLCFLCDSEDVIIQVWRPLKQGMYY